MVKMSKNFDFRPTLPPQTPTPPRNRRTYQNPELEWRVPIISVPDSNNCTKIPSVAGAYNLACLQGGRLTYIIALQWYQFLVVTSRRSCPSVYPSACHTRALWQNQTIHCRFLIPDERAIALVFWHQQWLVATPPDVWNLHLKWPIPLKNADFDRCSLITSQP